MASAAQTSRAAVFFGSGLRRAGTRFCARRNGDSFSASKSSRRASSSSSRAVSSGVEYNSSWMVEPLFRPIYRSVVVEIAEQIQYNFSVAREIEEILILLHRLLVGQDLDQKPLVARAKIRLYGCVGLTGSSPCDRLHVVKMAPAASAPNPSLSEVRIGPFTAAGAPLPFVIRPQLGASSLDICWPSLTVAVLAPQVTVMEFLRAIIPIVPLERVT